MNIIYHHRTQGRGVEGVHILGIVNAWRAAGHHVEVVSPPGVSMRESVQPSESELTSRWNYLSRSLPESCFELFELFYNFWAYQSLSKKLKKRDYDLVYERYSFMCLAGLWASRTAKTPFFLEMNYTTDTPIVRGRTRFGRILDRKVESRLLRDADGIIVVSSYLRDILLAQGVTENKILVLPNAADPDAFNPNLDPGELTEKLKVVNKKVVGFVGFFYPWHGIELLISTYKYVSSQINDVVYLLVGDGPIKGKVLETIRKEGYTDKILCIGSVDHIDVPRYISLFDLAIMPHSNEYGSPMKVLEYMAMGKAVVAPRLGPLEDIIDHGYNGILFKPGSEKEMAMAISTLLSDDRLRFSIGQGARKKILEKHNWKQNASNILKLYQKLQENQKTNLTAK